MSSKSISNLTRPLCGRGLSPSLSLSPSPVRYWFAISIYTYVHEPDDATFVYRIDRLADTVHTAAAAATAVAQCEGQ